MSKSKLTLVVDGNWLLMSRLSVMNNRYVNEEELMDELKLLMCKSINVVLRTFPLIDNIIFVSDGGSWRTHEKTPTCITKVDPNYSYKGNRVQDPSINWDIIFGGYEDFVKILNENGIQSVREKGVEGDDWCWYWSTKLNEEGTNVIIWSKDKDLTQLVTTNPQNGVFTVCWNKDYTTIEDTSEDEVDFLLNYEYSENEKYLRQILNRSKVVKRINPKEVIIDKIIRGDMGDNILPILMRKSRTNPNKEFRVSVKDIDFNLKFDDDSCVRTYISNLIQQKQYKDRVEKPLKDILEHFEFNKRLVYLHKSIYPQVILDITSVYEPKEPNCDIKNVESILLARRQADTSVLDSI